MGCSPGSLIPSAYSLAPISCPHTSAPAPVPGDNSPALFPLHENFLGFNKRSHLSAASRASLAVTTAYKIIIISLKNVDVNNILVMQSSFFILISHEAQLFEFLKITFCLPSHLASDSAGEERGKTEEGNRNLKKSLFYFTANPFQSKGIFFCWH